MVGEPAAQRTPRTQEVDCLLDPVADASGRGPASWRTTRPFTTCMTIFGTMAALAVGFAHFQGKSAASRCTGFLCAEEHLVSLAAAPDNAYYIMVDCGSSGTRFKLFHVHDGKIESLKSEKITMDAMSSYVGRLSDLEKHLRSAVNSSKQYIPEAKQAETELFMYATAGMRILTAADQRAVFSQCHTSLKDGGFSPYKFVDARTLSGEMEAAFQYLSVNYDAATGGIRSEPLGQLEMGGASLQVAFHPKDTVLDNSWVYDLLGKREIIYAKSYMGYGQNIARLKTQEAVVRAAKGRRLAGSGSITYPCFLKGYKENVTVFEGTSEQQDVLLEGSSDFASCRDLTEQILHKDYECDLAPCPFHGDYMPKLSGKFKAISGFKFSLLNIGLDAKATTPKQLFEGTKTFCAKDFKDLAGNTKFTRNECFLGTYAYTLLHAFGFPDTTGDVTFDGDYSWTLGAVLYEAFASSGPVRRRLSELPGVQSLPAMDHKCYWACRSERRCASLQPSAAGSCKEGCSARCSS